MDQVGVPVGRKDLPVRKIAAQVVSPAPQVTAPTLPAPDYPTSPALTSLTWGAPLEPLTQAHITPARRPISSSDGASMRDSTVWDTRGVLKHWRSMRGACSTTVRAAYAIQQAASLKRIMDDAIAAGVLGPGGRCGGCAGLTTD